MSLFFSNQQSDTGSAAYEDFEYSSKSDFDAEYQGDTGNVTLATSPVWNGSQSLQGTDVNAIVTSDPNGSVVGPQRGDVFDFFIQFDDAEQAYPRFGFARQDDGTVDGGNGYYIDFDDPIDGSNLGIKLGTSGSADPDGSYDYFAPPSGFVRIRTDFDSAGDGTMRSSVYPDATSDPSTTTAAAFSEITGTSAYDSGLIQFRDNGVTTYDYLVPA